jgi:beta-galactosidase
VNGHLVWQVPYAPGTLEARGPGAEGQALVTNIETTGAPAKIVLSPDRPTIDADGQDVSIVTVSVADDQGRIVPTADNLVKFTIDGDAKIIGVGNGNPSSQEPDKAEQRKVFNGLCMAIVQAGKSSGTIHLTVTADGLATATVTINAQAVTLTPAVE